MRCPMCQNDMYPESVYIQVCPYCKHKVDLRKGKKGDGVWDEVKKILKEKDNG